MSSLSRETRAAQKERAQARYETRKVEMEKSGADRKTLRRDPLLRKLEAELRKARQRLEAIDEADSHVRDVASKGESVKVKKGKGKKPKAQPQPADKKGGKQKAKPKSKKKK
ncbi:MAG: hypothetical protein R6V85_03645 [Polyangia bacterium]